MREVGARYQVAKNRIVKLALKDTKYENIIDLFSGPTAIAVSEDPVSAPKTIFRFAKENDKLSIIGGGLDGKTASVVPCCQTLGPPNEAKSVLGHLDTQSFEEVYFGDKYTKLREAHTLNKYEEVDYCKNCDFLYQRMNSYRHF